MVRNFGSIDWRVLASRTPARPLLVALFLGTTTLSGGFFTPAHAQVFAFSSVSIEGNERVDQATILSYAGIARGQEVSAAQLNDAYQRIVNSGLFETVEMTPQGDTLVIVVQEYPTINVINFEGNRRIKDDALAELISSQSRRVYSPATAESDAAAIAELYRVQGRLAASVEPKIIRRDGNRVDLVFEIGEGRVVEVERLSFVGNRAFSDRRLRQVLETKQAGLLRTLIRRDSFIAERLDIDRQMLTDFYKSRGYVDVQIADASADVTRERDATFVSFNIREGQKFAIGAVSTSSEIDGVDADEFAAVLRISTGQTWSPALIDTNITRMENLALRKGLNFIRVDPRVTRNDRAGTLDIEFVLVRGERLFVERIDIEGNATTLDQVIRRQFRTVEGDPFNPREIRQAAERIRALGFFKDAGVDAQPGSNPDQVVVKVDVEEQPTGSLSFGASYGVAQGVGLTLGFSETNFLGRGQALSVDLSVGTDDANTSLSFTEPAFLGRDLSFSVGAYYRTSDNDDEFFDTRNLGFTTGIGFPVSELGRLNLKLRIAQDEIFDVSPDSSAILIAEGARGSLVTSAVGYTYEYDNRVSGTNPLGGVLLRFSQEFAGIGGDTNYISTTGLALAERRIANEEVTLRAVIEGGVISTLGDEPSGVTERFFGGGKIRGFEPNGIGPRDLTAVNEDALGGNVFAVARFEAEFPLGLPEEYGITGGAFFDVGSVWSLDNAAGTGGPVDDSINLRSTVGLSIFWTTPIGPLRFNFSKALLKEDYDKEQSFDLTISTRF